MTAAVHLPILTPPRTRADCLGSMRPCPWECRHRIEAGPRTGACVLDEIDRRGDLTLEEVGSMLGVTRERARQIEKKALKKLARAARIRGIEFADLLPALRGASPLGGAIEDDHRPPSKIAKLKGTGRGRRYVHA